MGYLSQQEGGDSSASDRAKRFCVVLVLVIGGSRG